VPKGSMVYSHSRLETFSNCRLKFRYQYVDKVDVPRRESVEAFLGSRVHETLEQHYKNIMMGKMWTQEEYLAYFDDIWKKLMPENLHIVNQQYTQEDYYQQGVRSLTDYWKHYHPFDSEKTIALEKRIYMNLDDGDSYRFQGYVDRISKTADGIWQIRDYKTKRNLPTIEEAQKDRQLALYQMGLQKMWTDTDQVQLIWHYLLFDEEVKITKDKPDLEKTRIDTIHLIQEVETAMVEDDFPYHESALCEWCDFFDICPAKKHLAKVRTLPPEDFKREQGVTLVDRYAKLMEERKQNELEIQTVKDELFRFAEQFVVDKVYGSSHYVRVKVEESMQPPSASDREHKQLREELEEYLRASALWQEVSQFNPKRLIKILREGELAGKIRQEIERFLVLRTDKSLYSGKRKDVEEGQYE